LINLFLSFRLFTLHNGSKVSLKELSWEKQNIIIESKEKIRTLQIFPQKTCLFTILWIQRDTFLIHLSYLSYLSYFSGYVHTWHNGLKTSLKKLSCEKKWELRAKKRLEPTKTCLQIHYLQFYTSRSINFWKSHPIIQVWCTFIHNRYLGEPQRLNSLLKEHSCFYSLLVS
jgi:hypothetical protein